MATYQLIDLQTGEFRAVTLDEAAEISSLDPHDIEWAIEQEGVATTDTFQITKLNDPPEDGHSQPEGDCGEAGDADSVILIPLRVFDTQAEFDAWLLENPADVIRIPWDEPIVRDAVERQRDAVAKQLGSLEDGRAKPSAVYHLTREMIALIR